MRNRNQPNKAIQRFTTDEIVRAIDAVTKAGLMVHAVEITRNGSIKIETQPLSEQRPSTSKIAPDTDNVRDETLKKKQA